MFMHNACRSTPSSVLKTVSERCQDPPKTRDHLKPPVVTEESVSIKNFREDLAS